MITLDVAETYFWLIFLYVWRLASLADCRRVGAIAHSQSDKNDNGHNASQLGEEGGNTMVADMPQSVGVHLLPPPVSPIMNIDRIKVDD